MTALRGLGFTAETGAAGPSAGHGAAVRSRPRRAKPA